MKYTRLSHTPTPTPPPAHAHTQILAHYCVFVNDMSYRSRLESSAGPHSSGRTAKGNEMLKMEGWQRRRVDDDVRKPHDTQYTYTWFVAVARCNMTCDACARTRSTYAHCMNCTHLRAQIPTFNSINIMLLCSAVAAGCLDAIIIYFHLLGQRACVCFAI